MFQVDRYYVHYCYHGRDEPFTYVVADRHEHRFKAVSKSYKTLRAAIARMKRMNKDDAKLRDHYASELKSRRAG